MGLLDIVLRAASTFSAVGDRQGPRFNDAEVLEIAAPASLNKGQTFTATVTMKNTGAATWTSGPGGRSYRLGSQEPMDNRTWSLSRADLPLGEVEPGQSVTFALDCVAPSTRGIHQFSWSMVQDSVEWFGAPATLTINVTDPFPPPPADPNDAVSALIFDTRAYRTTDPHRTARWTNTTGRRLKIVKTYIWTGVDIGGKMDCHVQLNRDRDGSLLHLSQWDHYHDPVAPNAGRFVDYSPYYFTLEPDETLALSYHSSYDINDSRPFHAHHWCAIWAVYA